MAKKITRLKPGSIKYFLGADQPIIGTHNAEFVETPRGLEKLGVPFSPPEYPKRHYLGDYVTSTGARIVSVDGDSYSFGILRKSITDMQYDKRTRCVVYTTPTGKFVEIAKGRLIKVK